MTVHIAPGGQQDPPNPDPPWWARIRWGYHLATILLALPLSGPWARVLADVRDTESLAGAWVMAVIPLTGLAVWDNACWIRAACAHTDLWEPRIRAALSRLLLWAAVIATALTLPIVTLVYAMTGVHI
ncbi:hypothetical protein ABZ864_40455 [Streptomyces sp. NPDC047082]|uniref:hypothetical protein n=1 Tax=Streptomyces sp. NPDC047082 TaxID=3155259 RepID=UPI00340A74CB